MNEKIKAVMITASIPIIGFLSSFLIEPVGFYTNLNTPAFAPPPIIFPIAWTVLYTLLGIFFYCIIKRKDIKLLSIYLIQMLINLLWSTVFFTYMMFDLALVMIIVMFILTVVMFIMCMNNKYKYLLIPYAIWLCFAFYLNLSIIFMN